MSEASKYFDFIASQPDGVQFLDSNEEEAEQFWAYLSSPTAQGTSGIMGGLICNDKLQSDFVKQALQNANFIVINIHKGVLIGFACVMHYTIDDIRLKKNPDKDTYFYIELICNRLGPTISTRSDDEHDHRVGAAAMIKVIEQEAIKRNCDYVKLNAIEEVISYYAKLQFHFPFLDTDKKVTHANELIQALRNAQTRNNITEANIIYARIVQNFYPGFYTKIQDSLTETNPTKRLQEIAEKVKDEGIPMIKYLDENTSGGKKKRKKSKSKKKQRKTKNTRQRKRKSRKKKSINKF